MAVERQRFAVMADPGAAPVVVSASNLFPTPPPLARRVVDLAGIVAGHRVLEPSAGTGRLLQPLPAGVDLVAVEIDHAMAQLLRGRFAGQVLAADFLELTDLGQFDRIVMNPPFARGTDIRHIEHARKMLKPGGRLVAICANGPKQRTQLQPAADEWIDLPAGSFRSEGTDVNAAIVIFEGSGM